MNDYGYMNPAICVDCDQVFDGGIHDQCPVEGCPARGSAWIEDE